MFKADNQLPSVCYPGSSTYLVADRSDFVANEQEFHRRSNNSVIDLRALHEIYLEPFRLQCRANPVAFVCLTALLPD